MEKSQKGRRYWLVFNSLLLTLTLGLGFSSLIWGLHLGNQSIQGITHPNTQTLAMRKSGRGIGSPNKKVAILKEEDILNSVNNWIERQKKKTKQHKS